ncbi:MAG TPA: AAA family ATPase, partial [Pirellulales bacterium]|nr:AAA family ATPase [Pirellulales bacterium]
MRTLWPDPSTLAIATPHQREQYALATRKPVGILGGNPGAGKTFTSAQVIKAVVERFGEHDVAVGAPTGKAA